MNTYDTFEINDFKGTYQFEIHVEGNVTQGGSNAYGSDDPEWIECEITSIYNPKKNQPVSNRLFKALLDEYEGLFSERLCESYEG